MRVLGEAVDLHRRAYEAARATSPASLVLAALPHVVYAAGAILVDILLPTDPSERDALLWSIGIVVFTLVYLSATVFVIGVLSRITDAALERNPVAADAALETGFARFERLAVASVLYVLAVAAGLAVLIVPGFFVAALLLLWPHEIVREYRRPFEALARSAHVVRPRLGTVALAVAPVLLVVLLLAGGGLAVYLLSSGWIGAILQALAGFVATLGLSCLGSAVYRERAPAAQAEDEEIARRETAPRLPDGRVRYVCPRCQREYILPRMPPVGAVCPECRAADQASGRA